MAASGSLETLLATPSQIGQFHLLTRRQITPAATPKGYSPPATVMSALRQKPLFFYSGGALLSGTKILVISIIMA